MSQDEVTAITLDYQAKFNLTVPSIGDFKSDFRRLELELPISRSINSFSLERQCWANNQCSRRECLDITGLP